jgi:hypothetical protein
LAVDLSKKNKIAHKISIIKKRVKYYLLKQLSEK